MRIVLFIIFSLAVAWGTLVSVRGLLESERARTDVGVSVSEEIQRSANVLVAAQPVAAGAVLTAERLRWQAWPADAVAEEFITDVEASFEDYHGSVARQAMTIGEPLTAAKVVNPGDRGFLAAVLRPGMRAVSVDIDAASGIAGLVFPGDRVDVLLTHTLEPAGSEGRPVHASETVLRDIRVLAVDQRLDRENAGLSVGKTATLEVSPKQAEALALVTELGRLSLTLRSLRDELAGEAGSANPSYTVDDTVSQLLGRRPAPASAPQPQQDPPPSKVVNVIRGSSLEVLDFRGTN